jgi:hypothetical protein
LAGDAVPPVARRAAWLAVLAGSVAVAVLVGRSLDWPLVHDAPILHSCST